MTVAWITGAHGFIGRHLAHHLKSLGYTVAGIGHGAWPQAEAEQWGLSFWLNGEISASNLSQMENAFGIPEVVYHLAGGSSVGVSLANPHEDFSRTVISTAALLEWLRQNAPAARLVAVSSAAVYGAKHHGPIPEDARLAPYSPYGTHKLMMEELCCSYGENYGLRIVLPRLFSVYGAGLKKQLLWDLCEKIASRGQVELGGSGDELRDWTDVRDVVRGLERIALFADERVSAINLATGIATPVREIATMVMSSWPDAGSRDMQLFFNGRSRPGDPFSLVANVEAMRRYGIECRIPVNQGVAEYVSWFCSQSGVTR